MDSHSGRLKTLKASADKLIYASIFLGATLLIQLFAIVPVWLFYSVLAGWIAYLLVALAVAKGLKMAYPLSLVLAILTLAVSLPRPEHDSLVQSGPSPASLTFIAGSVLQVAVILTVTSYLFMTRGDGVRGH
ncbi:hypothetical protein E6H21_10320 [Candidatus Bathyarchaeota archaeon]|nr:MAG: hypothetical protein E6H21_10320 [Candidatus Bathyarchaeota archaeon]